MPGLLSLGFEFRDSYHSYLARVKEKGDYTEYHISIMDAALDSLLQGNHILHSRQGQILMDEQHSGSEPLLLKSEIIKSLNKYLHARALTSESS
jgi:hypothetical protein